MLSKKVLRVLVNYNVFQIIERQNVCGLNDCAYNASRVQFLSITK